MEPEYVAVRSALYDFSFLICLLLLVLGVIPGVIYIICKVVSAHHCTAEFYQDKAVLKSGVFNTDENEFIFKGVLFVKCERTLRGKIFGYGSVHADIAGKHNFLLEGVKDPEGLKKYLQTKKIDPAHVKHAIVD